MALERFVRARIAELRERREFDAVEHFAAAVPVEIICTLLSVPDSERGHLRRWSLAILGALEPAISPEQARIGNEAVREFLAYLRDLISFRRRNPASERYNVLRSLVEQADGGELSEAELAAQLHLPAQCRARDHHQPDRQRHSHADAP